MTKDERTKKIITGLSYGFTSKQIGQVMGLSQKTVESHIALAKSKYGATNSVHLVSILLSRGEIFHLELKGRKPTDKDIEWAKSVIEKHTTLNP